MVEAKRAVCEMCHARCRVVVHSENGRLVSIEEDRSDPLVGSIFPPTRGCLRLGGAKEFMYHPHRVNFPLRRTGEKGEGKWERISWDQALDEIAQGLREIKQRYGAESLVTTAGTLRTREEYQARFLNLFGTPNNMGQAKICFAPQIATCSLMFGRLHRHRASITVGGATTRLLLLAGIGSSQSTLRLWDSVRKGKKVGLKIIVIDPRKTPEAELADIWLQLRPGTDTALFMSMINVVIEEGLYDKEFVNQWCYGFDKLVERAKEYPPEKVAEITSVLAENIREAARMYANNRPTISLHGMGTEHLANNIEAIAARLSLAAIIGDIDNEGGHYIPEPPRYISEPEVTAHEMLPAEQKRKQLGADRFKLLSWPGFELINKYSRRVWSKDYCSSMAMATPHDPTAYRAMLTGNPYPVRAAITNHSNPMVTQPNTKLVYKALKSLDLYVVMDFWLTPSAELADYVLPAASWLERPFLYTIHGVDSGIEAGEKALPSSVPGEYDHKTDYELWRELGIRLGQEQYWPWQDLEQAFDYRLKPMGMTHKEFMAKGGYDFPPNKYKKHEEKGFGTATGKVELYSTILEQLGYDPLPKYEEPFETLISQPELAKEYPLMLITGGRYRPMFHSEQRQIDSIRKRHPHPLVQINPETAKKLDIMNGDWVWIESPRGRIRMKCQYFDGIDPRVIHCEHGWWFPELPGEEPWLHGVWESNVNVLMDDEPDHCNPISGGWPLKTALCRVYKIKGY